MNITFNPAVKVTKRHMNALENCLGDVVVSEDGYPRVFSVNGVIYKNRKDVCVALMNELEVYKMNGLVSQDSIEELINTRSSQSSGNAPLFITVE